jgi:predicted small secreted protein
MNKNISLLIALCLLTGFLGACSNTWDGAGKDLQGTGQWLEETF